jgi:hypothetical protein
MLLDLVEFVGPALLVGVWKLEGILLGSTSHYLVHRASVTVVVARRTSRRELAASASRRRGLIAWRAGWIRMCSICATRCRRMTTAAMRMDCERRQAPRRSWRLPRGHQGVRSVGGAMREGAYPDRLCVLERNHLMAITALHDV